MGLAGTNACAKYATAGIIAAATAVAFAGTAAGNFAYGLTQGTDSPFLWTITTKQIASWGFLAMDFAALGFAVACGRLYREKSWGPLCFVAVLCAYFSVFALTNTMGFMGMEKASADELKRHGASGYAALAEDLARMKLERGFVPRHRPLDVVAADISEKEMDPLYVRSKSCGDITKDDSRKFCGELQALRTEAAAAGSGARLDRDIRSTQARLNATPPIIAADSLAVSAEDLFGITQDHTNRYRPFLAAIGVWLLATFGMAVADMVMASSPVQKSPSNLPVIEVVRPPEVPSFQAPVPLEKAPDPKEDAPYLEPEKPLETAVGQAPDSIGRNVTKMLPKPVTAEQGVAEWARQMPEGRHFLHGFKLEYQAYAKRRNLKTVRLHSLASVLEGLGYQKGKEKGGKVYVIFPKVLASHPRVALG